MFDCRWFLSSGILIGGAAVSNQLFAKIASAPKHLPVAALYSGDEDTYWADIRKQFLIPEDEVFLNNGTVGSSPAPVLRAVFDAYNEIEKLAPEDPEDYPLSGYGPRPRVCVCRLLPRRTRPGAQRHVGHQLCRERV